MTQNMQAVLVGLGLCVGVAIGQSLPNRNLWWPVAAVVGAAVTTIVVNRIKYRRKREAVISERLGSLSGRNQALRIDADSPTEGTASSTP